MRVLTLTIEPRRVAYSALLQTALGRAHYVQFVRNPAGGGSFDGDQIIKRLRPYLNRQFDTAEWPGTILHGGTVQLFRYRYKLASADIILASSRRLYAWRQPRRPEDLSLLRADGTVWLFSIAHEHDGGLVLTDDEYKELCCAIPDFPVMVRDDPEGLDPTRVWL